MWSSLPSLPLTHYILCFLSPQPRTLQGWRSCYPEGLFLNRRQSKVPAELKVIATTRQFKLFMTRHEQQKRGVTILAWLIDTEKQKEGKTALHKKGRKEHMWNSGNTLSTSWNFYQKLMLFSKECLN